MKIWISKNSEVSVREQIIAQISLGIISKDLTAGEKLPSTRELARRFQIHQNTVSSAYRELADENLVEFKKGSGVYVREEHNISVNTDTLDQIISRFLHETAAQGFSADEIKMRLEKHFAAKSQPRFLIVESDLELQKILIEEVRAQISGIVEAISDEEFTGKSFDDTPIYLIFDVPNNVHRKLPTDKNCIFLKPNSVPNSMIGKTRPSENDLIAVVSRWEKFLELAKIFLLAARISPETLILRSANDENWQNGLQNVSLIICDLATAKELPADERVRVFQLIADSSLDELQKLT